MMNHIYTNSIAAMEFRFNWKSGVGSHTDAYYVQNVNLWRDIFPKDFYEKLMNKTSGDVVHQDFHPGELISGYNSSGALKLKHNRIDGDMISRARYGRFYPKGALKDIPGVFKANIEPFRCTDVNGTGVHVDLNHPLAGRELSLEAVVEEVHPKFSERGGSCMALEELVNNGPGMQARMNGGSTDFFSDNPFERPDESDDAGFYTHPRLVNHLDDAAISVLAAEYGGLIPPGSKVLDLMSSWTSHLPDDLDLDSVTGLGMNQVELDANPRLTSRLIHDLNQNPVLPFGAGEFDAVTCAMSVEYLTRPFEVFVEAARVLKPGGKLIVSFSNRWFPPKAIRIWTELHDFERMGLVTEYFLKHGQFSNIHTWSMRGKPRPVHDKHFGLNMMLSDPVYMVWGVKNG